MARFDLILAGGTVLDPVNAMDGVADIGVKSGRIEAVAPELDPFDTDKTVDVTGKWVMPGQIDTHAHVAGLARNWDPAIGYGMLAKAAESLGYDHILAYDHVVGANSACLATRTVCR